MSSSAERSRPSSSLPVPSWMEQAQARKRSEAAESKRESVSIARRAADRLVLADARSQGVQAGLAAEKGHQASSLDHEAKRTQQELVRYENTTMDQVANMTMLRYQKDADAAQYAATKDDAVRCLDATRSQREYHMARIEADICRVSEEADAALAAGRSETRVKLDELRRQRAEIEAQSHRKIEAHEGQTQTAIVDLQQRSHAEVLGSEAYRHRAAMSIDRFGELLQAAKSVAGSKAKLTEEKAEKEADGLVRARHQAQRSGDAAINNILKASAAEISAARQHCSQVSTAHANDAALYARRMEQLHQDAEQRARDAERQVYAVEGARLQDYAGNRSAVRETEEKLQAGRDACGQELDGINRRLHELEEVTRAKAAEIFRQWSAGTQGAEQTVRSHEQRGRDALEELREAMERVRREAQSRNEALQREGASAVAQLERRAGRSVDAAQPALEEARRDDEEATLAALAKLRELRPEPERLEAAADAKISELAAQVARDEERLRQQADARVADSKAAIGAARSEERRLLAESADAWQRLRKACYQLRLMNLHDFAEGIVAGGFDSLAPH